MCSLLRCSTLSVKASIWKPTDLSQVDLQQRAASWPPTPRAGRRCTHLQAWLGRHPKLAPTSSWSGVAAAWCCPDLLRRRWRRCRGRTWPTLSQQQVCMFLLAVCSLGCCSLLSAPECCYRATTWLFNTGTDI